MIYLDILFYIILKNKKLVFYLFNDVITSI